MYRGLECREHKTNGDRKGWIADSTERRCRGYTDHAADRGGWIADSNKRKGRGYTNQWGDRGGRIGDNPKRKGRGYTNQGAGRGGEEIVTIRRGKVKTLQIKG